MAVVTVILLVVAGVAALVGAVALATYLAALREHKAERALRCDGCSRTGPFPERVMTALRLGLPTSCPDCDTPLVHREARRSA